MLHLILSPENDRKKSSLLSLVAGALLCTTALCAPCAAQAGTVGVDFTGANNILDFGIDFTLGYSFRANNAVSVVGLGTYNNGVSGNMTVGLWDSAQNLLASTIVTTGSPILGTANWLFESIGPVALTAGNVYYVASHGDARYAFDVTGFTVDPNITFLNNAWQHGGLNFPGLVDLDPRAITGFYGGNVELAATATATPVPEPATLTLLSVGLLAVGASRRRKVKA
jgi:Domain of unknown function (DUF4082)/PEP-CTERM motif